MKILIPTDFSENSKPGTYLAIQIAALNDAELVFIHVFNAAKFQQNEVSYAEEKEKEIMLKRLMLEKFIADAFDNMKITPRRSSCEVIEGFKADIAIVDYCRHHHEIDYICISTRGAGLLNKLLGTNTGNLIAQSPVPVIAVPSNYKIQPLHTILYAADLHNYEAELNKVIEFASPIQLKVEILHFLLAHEQDEKSQLTAEIHKNIPDHTIKTHFKINDLEVPLIKQLKEQLQQLKPSIAVLFTKQDRTFFEKLFLSSMAEELSFKSSVPVLVFNKNFQFDKKGIEAEKIQNMGE